MLFVTNSLCRLTDLITIRMTLVAVAPSDNSKSRVMLVAVPKAILIASLGVEHYWHQRYSKSWNRVIL